MNAGKLFSLTLIISLFILTQGFAQLIGAKSIPGDYATIEAAISDLNLLGVGTGGVTFNVAAGHTETVTTPIIITATGIPGDAIIFQKSGAGVNPLIIRTDAGSITSTVEGGLGDAVIRLDGTDYITFDGIDLAASDQSIENGYFTFKPSPVNGCRFVTIKNCVITMTKGASRYVNGIYISNGPAVSSATGVSVSAPEGMNSNIKITGNTIQNVHSGIYVRGSLSYYDSVITIGQPGAGNIIQNFGGGTAAAAHGVYFIYVESPSAAYNTIDNEAGGGSPHNENLYCINYSIVSGDVTGRNNTMKIANTGELSSNYYIRNTNTGTSEVYENNTFAQGSVPFGKGITFFIYSTNSTNNKTISGNATAGTIFKNGGGTYCYYNDGNPTGGTETVTNNTFSNIIINANPNGFYGIYSNTAAGQTKVFSENTISNITSLGTGSFYCFYAGSSDSTLVNNNTAFNISHAGSIYGLYLSGSSSGVYKNNIHGLTSTTTGTQFVYGIYIPSGFHNIYNNFISDLNAPASTNTVAGAVGINVSGGTETNLYYNTIYLKYISTAAANQSAALYIGSTTPAAVNMLNNIFINNVDVTTGTRAMVIRKGGTSLTNLVNLNYNLYYASVQSPKNVVFFDGINTDETLASYKIRVIPNESQSVTEMPPFKNSTTAPYDLHMEIGPLTQTDGGGAYIVTVTDDYDGDMRMWMPDIGADEFEVFPSYPMNPYAVSASPFSSNQIDVLFTPSPDNHNVVIVFNLDGVFTLPSGTPPAPGSPFAGGTLLANTLTSPFNHTGLSAATTYFYKLFSFDGAYYSSGVTVNAITFCNSVMAFSENFDSVTSPALPGCWAKTGTSGSVYTQTGNPLSGPNTLYLYGTSAANTAMVSLPPVSNAGAGTHWLRFQARGYTTTGGKLLIGYLTNPLDPLTFTAVDSVVISSLTYSSYTINPGTAPGVNQYLAIKHTGNPARSILIEDVVWEPRPCLAPAALIASGFTAASADLSWTETGTATAWDIEYGAVPFTPSGTPSVSGVTNPYSLGGLTASTEYAYYVRSSCGGGEFSSWSGPCLFSTAPATFWLTLNVLEGWNLVSIPGLHPVNQNVTTWWSGKDPDAGVFKFQAGYQPVIAASPGTGYWMKNLTNQTYNTGDEWPAGGIIHVPNEPISAAAGWNLFGGYEFSALTAAITTTPPGLQTGSVYQYTGGYTAAAVIEPCYGYWIKLTSAGMIYLNPSGPMKPVFVSTEGFGKITITDNLSHSYTLYAVEGEADLSQFDLPPYPPQGMFDVRYSSQRYAENLSSTPQVIEMMGVQHPVKVKAEGVGIIISDEIGKELARLKAGEEASLNTSAQKLIVSENVIPTVYALEQNYPNPFNPSTTIQFSIPEDVQNVKLIVYSALGEKAAELVNTGLQAGVYKYTWDAGNYSSSIYIYQLITEKFVATKKMILLK